MIWKYVIIICALSFHLLNITFSMEMFLVLIKSNLSIFLLRAMLLVSWVRTLSNLKSQIFSHFACNSFLCLSFKHSSVIHFLVVIFGMLWGKGLNSSFSMWISNSSSTIGWKDYPFTCELPWHLCRKINTLNVRVDFRSLSSVLSSYMSALISVSHCLDDSRSYISFEIRRCKSLNFVQIYISIWEKLTY